MKRNIAIMVTVFFWGVISTAFLSSPVYAFWYGDDISESLSDATEVGLHDYVVNNVLTELDPQPFFADGPLHMPNPIPDDVAGVTIYKKKETWDGYTLLSSIRNADGYGAVLIDMDGSLIQKWPFPFAFPAKMLPDGYVMGQFATDAGGAGGNALDALVQMDWCGEPMWEWAGEDGQGSSVHHDYQRENNSVGYYAPGQMPYADKGKTLILTNDNPDLIDTPHISDMVLLDDVFVEVDWDGNILWEWHAWEHVDEMGFDEEARDAIRSKRVGANPTETDWTHMNTLSYLGPNKWYKKGKGDPRFHPDNVIWDGRSNNIIAIVARHDDPDAGIESGDIVWKVGPDYSTANPEYKLGTIIGPHMAHMIPKELPGDGNILVFDNGGTAGYGSLLPGMPGHYPNTYRDFSRVIEFDPITLNVVWEYRRPRPRYDEDGNLVERMFYSRLISGAQRLKNGNTLITEGGNGRVFEVTPGGKIVWEYINEHGGGVGGPPLLAFSSRAVYRAYRIPYQWVDGNMLWDRDGNDIYDVCE